MALHKIKKGLNLPIAGEPEQRIEQASQPRRVALMADDYVGLKPTMHISVGDDVQRGQLLFEDKKTPGVRHASPASGTVVAVNRGERQGAAVGCHPVRCGRVGWPRGRSLISFLFGQGSRCAFAPRGQGSVARVGPLDVPARQAVRPGRGSRRRAAFAVRHGGRHESAGAERPDAVLGGREADFERGLLALAKLTDGQVYLCASPGSSVSTPEGAQFRLEHFAGPHPAGTAGVHIHRLDPVDRNKTVWYICYQDAVAIGKLFSSGVLDVERVISLAGPAVRRPRLLRTRLGAATDDLVARELADGENRLISGIGFVGPHGLGRRLRVFGAVSPPDFRRC